VHRPEGENAFERSRRIALALAASVLGVSIFGAVAAPVLEGSGWTEAWAVRLLYAPFCHQLADRSLRIAGEPIAVCARCLGLYLGGFVALGAAALLRVRPEKTPRWVFFAACAPTLVDGAAPWAGLPSLPDVPRFLLAWPTGFVIGWFLAAAIRDWATMMAERRIGSGRAVAGARSG